MNWGDHPGDALNAPRWVAALLGVAIFGLSLVVYWAATGFGFVNIDDQTYVTGNTVVLKGLTWEGFTWAFTSMHGSNWHPLTWLSHMVDVDLFGLNAGKHHLVSILIHAVNSVLLFAWLRRATGAVWRSALVAALFAVHPLHVESVAWISERKDVLSTFFWLVAMFAYLEWERHRDGARYAVLAGTFALGLLAKPMVVTLPFALLLVDAWPLGRLGGLDPEDPFDWRRVRPLVREKLPLFGARGSLLGRHRRGPEGLRRGHSGGDPARRSGRERARLVCGLPREALLARWPRRVLPAPIRRREWPYGWKRGGRVGNPRRGDRRGARPSEGSPPVPLGLALVPGNPSPRDRDRAGGAPVPRRSLRLHPLDRGPGRGHLARRGARSDVTGRPVRSCRGRGRRNRDTLVRDVSAGPALALRRRRFGAARSR